MNKLEELYARVHYDPKIIATLPIEEVDLLLNDMGLDLTTFMEKELKFIHEVKAQWQQEEEQKTTLPEKILETIISLVTPPLEQIVSAAGDKTTQETVLSLNGQRTVEKNDSSLTVYHDENGWILSFRTVLPKLIDKNVFLIIIDSDGIEILRELKKLEDDDEVWMFEYSLDRTIKRVESYTIKIQYSNGEPGQINGSTS